MEINLYGIEFEVEADKIDDTFDHQFGRQKYKPRYEITSIKVAGIDLIEVLDQKIIEKLEEKYNEAES